MLEEIAALLRDSWDSESRGPECILDPLSCNLADSALVNEHDLLTQAGKGPAGEEEDPPDEPEETGGVAVARQLVFGEAERWPEGVP